MNRRVLFLALSLFLGVSGAVYGVTAASADPLSTIQADRKELLIENKQNHVPSPTSLQVMSTPKQKMDASLEAVQIHENDPNVAPTMPAPEVKRPTVALALGGGGCRGAAHIGVLRALAKHNIPIDYIVGNSMGAIVGGFYCAGVSPDDIQKMLFDKSLMHSFMPISIPAKVLVTTAGKLAHPLGSKRYAGLWTGDRLEKYLKCHLPDPDMQVGDTKIPFSSVATNLVDGKAYRISDGPLSRAMRASASLSPIIKPIQIGDKVYVDGGVRANLPCSSAKETGADVVIGVLVDEPLKPIEPKKFKHLTGIASRLTDIILAVSDERQLEFADVVINPDVSGVEVLSKDPADVTKAAEAGELATEKAIPAILKKLEEAKAHSRVAAQPNRVAQ